MTRKKKKINQANDEVAKVTEAYSTGYTQRVSQEDGFTQKLQEYQEKRKKKQPDKHRDDCPDDSLCGGNLACRYGRKAQSADL